MLDRVRHLLAAGGMANEPSESWGPRAVVDSWVESDGDVLRIVYTRWEIDAPTYGYCCDVASRRDVERVPVDEIAGDVVDAISEPLGRQGELLVEEQGVWWWGDGYPSL